MSGSATVNAATVAPGTVNPFPRLIQASYCPYAKRLFVCQDDKQPPAPCRYSTGGEG